MTTGRALKPNERAMMTALSVQAWEYYEAGRKLLPLIDADSRAALWVLVEIYSGLLARIDRRQGDVFSVARECACAREGVHAGARGGDGVAQAGRVVAGRRMVVVGAGWRG